MKQNRLKSKVVWLTITSALLLLCGEWGLYDLIGIKQEVIQHTIDFVLLALTTFGILNNPTSEGDF